MTEPSVLLLPPIRLDGEVAGGPLSTLEIYGRSTRLAATLLIDAMPRDGLDPAIELMTSRFSSVFIAPLTKGWVSNLVSFARILVIARRSEIVLVNSSVPASLALGWLVAKLSGRPLVVTIHHVEESTERMLGASHKPWIESLGARAIRSADRILCCDNGVNERILPRLLPSKLVVPVSLAGTTIAHPLTGTRKNIDALFLGRLEARKGAPYLPEIWERVVAQVPSAHLLIVTSSARHECEALQQGFAGRGLGRSVTLLPRVTEREKQEILGRSRLLLFPSVIEGFGYVLAEALSAGVPACIWDVPSLARFTSGVLRAPFPDSSEFAQNVSSLLTDENLRGNLGAQGSSFALREFDWTRAVDSVESALLGTRSPREV